VDSQLGQNVYMAGEIALAQTLRMPKWIRSDALTVPASGSVPISTAAQ
jgi:hypothetical protein